VRVLLSLAALTLAGCASTGVSYIHPGVDFGHIKRCAVLPFRNLTTDNLADERMRSIFLMEVLNEGVLEVAGRGETDAAVVALRISMETALTPDQIVSLGQRLSVDAVFFGTIEEYGLTRLGRARSNEVTAVFGLAETQTGVVVWQSQVHLGGTSLWQKLFGGDPPGLYDVSRKAVREALRTLF
jgi:hypothetical protein